MKPNIKLNVGKWENGTFLPQYGWPRLLDLNQFPTCIIYNYPAEKIPPKFEIIYNSWMRCTHISQRQPAEIPKKSRNKLNELLWIEKPDVRLTHLKLLHTSGHCNDDSLLRLSTMVSMQVVWLEIECNYGFCLWWVTALTPFKPEEQTHDKRVEQQSMENGMKVMTIHEHTTNWYQLYTKHYLHLDKLHRMHYT